MPKAIEEVWIRERIEPEPGVYVEPGEVGGQRDPLNLLVFSGEYDVGYGTIRPNIFKDGSHEAKPWSIPSFPTIESAVRFLVLLKDELPKLAERAIAETTKSPAHDPTTATNRTLSAE